MPLIEANDLQLDYAEIGQGAPVVFCHGLAGSYPRELPWAKILGKHGYKVVLFSARGHGKSTPVFDPEAYTFQAMVEDLRAVMDRLELEKAVVGGGSMGAATSLGFALKYPERLKALIQLGPAFGADRPEFVSAAFTIFADLIEEYGVDQAIDRISKNLPFLNDLTQMDPGIIQDMKDQWNTHDLASIVAAMRGVLKSRPFRDISELESINVPTLIVSSPDDPIHPMTVAEEYSRRIPDSELKVVPLSPPIYRRPAELAELIRRFCDRVG